MDTSLQVDSFFKWPLGTAERLARRGKLPYFLLPNGELRFDLVEIQKLTQYIPATCDGLPGSGGRRARML